MPVWNEATTAAKVVEMVLAQRAVRQLIIFDDASTDGTSGILSQLAACDSRITLIRHPSNRGKGASLRTGFAAAQAPFVIVQDADLEYDPAEFERLLNPLLSGKADVVYGSRFLGYGERRVLYFWHSVGNHLLTLLCNSATNLTITDMETCYKVFRREVIQAIEIEEKRFGFEPEVTAKLAKMKVRIYEVPVSYYGRTYAEGKKIGWRDGLWALWCILKYNFLR